MFRIGIIAVLTGTVLCAQAPAPSTFEVASIKPNTSGSGNSRSSTRPDGSYVATNVSARMIILTAYRLRPFELIGGPSWLDGDRFDVNAKPPQGTPEAQLPVLLQALLAERFKLATHRETREQPIYTLILARTDGRLGPRLTPSTADCSPAARAVRASGTGAATAPPQPGSRPVCGMNTSVNNSSGIIRAGGRTIAELLPSLGSLTDRTVVDRTGLSGSFDVELDWNAAPLRSNTPDTAAGAAAADGPSFFTALQEQLGLKLEGARGPVDVVVIDRVEPPTPD